MHGHRPAPDRGCVPRTIHAVSLNGLPLCNGAPPRTSWRPFRPFPSGKAGQPGGTRAWRKAPARRSRAPAPRARPWSPCLNTRRQELPARVDFFGCDKPGTPRCQSRGRDAQAGGGLLPAAPARAQEARQFSPCRNENWQWKYIFAKIYHTDCQNPYSGCGGPAACETGRRNAAPAAPCDGPLRIRIGGVLT